MTGTALFFLGYGVFFGGLIGWWTRGRRDRTDESRQRATELAGILREMHAAPTDPDVARRARLAYDAIYDERHPEEWA